MTYTEQLRDPRWQKKRLEIFQRDEFRCRLCFDDLSTLHVHHLRYGKKGAPWDCDNADLATLCEHCHKSVEDDLAKARSLTGDMISAMALTRFCELMTGPRCHETRVIVNFLGRRQDFISKVYDLVQEELLRVRKEEGRE